MELKLITDVSDLAGKTVLVRASCNVPLIDGEVRNSFRLRRALPTLKYLIQVGARVIVISHLGRETTDTLLPVFNKLKDELPLVWGGTIATKEFETVLEKTKTGEIIFCENLRQDHREEENNKEWASKIASYADLYVNDAFAEVHREHTSTYGVAKLLPAYAGITLAEEVYELQRVMSPESPSVLLLGGAKFETKMPLVEKYLALYDWVFVGGALANDIFKARGFEVGQSLVSDISLEGASFLTNKKLIVPIDVIVDGPNGVMIKAVDEVLVDEKIFDMGPKTIAMLETHLKNAKTILWNGPFGNYEAGFQESTETVAKIIADTQEYSVLGGGDTIATVEKLGLNDSFGFVSIGGGSMLTFLENGSTPVLELLKNKNMVEIELASWYIEGDKEPIKITVTESKYLDFLSEKEEDKKYKIAEFIYQRLYCRYIRPFEYKEKVYINNYKNGFSIMANNCLLIETLQSFKKGWKDTDRRSESAFCNFFISETNFSDFRNTEFYKNVRCGILHQGETTGGWKISRKGKLLDNKTVNADKFSRELKATLTKYKKDLESQEWDSSIWKNLRKKMDHIIKNSKE